MTTAMTTIFTTIDIKVEANDEVVAEHDYAEKRNAISNFEKINHIAGESEKLPEKLETVAVGEAGQHKEEETKRRRQRRRRQPKKNAGNALAKPAAETIKNPNYRPLFVQYWLLRRPFAPPVILVGL